MANVKPFEVRWEERQVADVLRRVADYPFPVAPLVPAGPPFSRRLLASRAASQRLTRLRRRAARWPRLAVRASASEGGGNVGQIQLPSHDCVAKSDWLPLHECAADPGVGGVARGACGEAPAG